MSGGMSCALVPNGSLSCHVLSQLMPPLPQLAVVHESILNFSDHEIDPSDRFQPSPSAPAGDCGLCCSPTLALLYVRWSGGVSPPGPAGTSIGTSEFSPPPDRSTLKGSGLPNEAIAACVFHVIAVLGAPPVALFGWIAFVPITPVCLPWVTTTGSGPGAVATSACRFGSKLAIALVDGPNVPCDEPLALTPAIPPGTAPLVARCTPVGADPVFGPIPTGASCVPAQTGSGPLKIADTSVKSSAPNLPGRCSV